MSRQRTQIYLEAAQIVALDARAGALGVTRSDLIRDFVDQGLANPSNKPSLYEVVMRLGPVKGASMTPAAFAKRRAQLEAEFEERAGRNNARRRRPSK
jgi:Ribbon-helix-helix protein, copG family